MGITLFWYNLSIVSSGLSGLHCRKALEGAPMHNPSYRKTLLAISIAPPKQTMSRTEVYEVLNRVDREAALIGAGVPSALELPVFRNCAYTRDERENFEIFKTANKLNLKEILYAYGNKCFYCKCSFEVGADRRKWRTWDHMTPISRGGRNDMSNLVPCCFSCNNKKHHKTADEFLMAFR